MVARSSMPVRKSAKGRPWVASIAVVVSDKERAKRWYTEKLGLELLSDDEHWVCVGRKGMGAMLHLCEYPEAGRVELEPGTTGILLLLDGDLAEHVERLSATGVEVVTPVTDHPWGSDATVRDPDGNEVLLMPSG